MAKKKIKRRYSGKKKKFDTDAALNGAIAEFGPAILSNFVGPDLAGPVTHAAVAYFRNDSHAAYQAGREFAQLFGRGGLGGMLGGGNANGAFFD
jgi:hypothetical protein